MSAPELTEAEQRAARACGMDDEEYAFWKSRPNGDDVAEFNARRAKRAEQSAVKDAVREVLAERDGKAA